MNRIWCLLALAVALLPAVASGVGHGGAHEVNWWRWSIEVPPVGWHLLDFLVFVGVLVFFGRKPLKKMLATRHDTIHRAISENEAAYVEAKASFDAARDRLATIEQTARDVVANIEASGVEEHARIVAGARSYAERLREDSSGILATEFSHAKLRLRRAVAARALELAEQTIVETVDGAIRGRMIDEAIAEIEQDRSLDALTRGYVGGLR